MRTVRGQSQGLAPATCLPALCFGEVNTGDNFYYCGITGTADRQVAEDFTNVYTDKSLQVGVDATGLPSPSCAERASSERSQ